MQFHCELSQFEKNTFRIEFGELVEPDTRAFWGNYDEFDEENTTPAVISWKWMDEDSSDGPFKRLFIVEGREIFNFVQTSILKKLSPICQIDGFKTSVYKIPGTGDNICVSEDNDLDQSAQMTELLSPWLKNAEKTFLFSFQSAYTYNTDKEFDKRCFIRTISNTASEFDFDGTSPMEDCNIVYGVSAGAATFRQINQLPFTCYAVYMDCMQIDSLVGSMVLKLFNKLGMPCDSNYVVKTINKSNLYM